MYITTDGGKTFEVRTPEDVIAAFSGNLAPCEPGLTLVHQRTKEDILVGLCDLAAEASDSHYDVLSTAILTVVNGCKLQVPQRVKDSLVWIGQKMVAAVDPAVAR